MVEDGLAGEGELCVMPAASFKQWEDQINLSGAHLPVCYVNVLFHSSMTMPTKRNKMSLKTICYPVFRAICLSAFQCLDHTYPSIHPSQ